MFVGHTAVALAAKSRVPDAPLWILIAAVFGLDLLWPLFLLLGAEQLRIEPGITAVNPFAFDYYPWSHSLILAMVWGALFAIGCSPRMASVGRTILVGALVVSHWVLDVVMHRPDLPLWPGPSPLLGLGLWNSIPASLLVEGALFAAAIAIYLRASKPKDRTGTVALWSLLLLQASMWLSGPWMPPPSARAVAWGGLAMWLFLPWAAWIDRHREMRG